MRPAGCGSWYETEPGSRVREERKVLATRSCDRVMAGLGWRFGEGTFEMIDRGSHLDVVFREDFGKRTEHFVGEARSMSEAKKAVAKFVRGR